MTGVPAARMIGGNCPHRSQDDFYPSPDEITIALFQNWTPRHGEIWEPACGDGAMCRVIEGHGYDVTGTDLVDRGYGDAGVDFLLEQRLAAPCIITNPPFNLSAKFIEHAHGLGCDQMALFLKCSYWHAERRLSLFERYQPAAIMPLTWRPDFNGGGQPTLDMLWCTWDRQHAGETLYRPIRRPNGHKAIAELVDAPEAAEPDLQGVLL